MFNQSKYVNDFAKENYARLTVLIPKGAKRAVEEHIASRGYKSTSDYFKSLLARDMGVTDLSELIGGGGAKMMKKIKNRLLQLREKMREHQLLSFIAVGLILYALLELLKINIIFKFILIFIAIIYVKKQTIIESEKAKMDYLAKKIAEENAKKKDPQ